MDYAIRGFASIGEFALGMDRQAVHSLFAEAPVVRSNDEHFPVTDWYPQRLLRFEYDTQDSLAFIEVSPPNAVTLDGIELLDRPLMDVATDLLSIGLELRQDLDPTCYSVNDMLTLWIDDDEIKTVSLRTAEYTRLAALDLAKILAGQS